jgi:hypothetical protein
MSWDRLGAYGIIPMFPVDRIVITFRSWLVAVPLIFLILNSETFVDPAGDEKGCIHFLEGLRKIQKYELERESARFEMVPPPGWGKCQGGKERK